MDEITTVDLEAPAPAELPASKPVTEPIAVVEEQEEAPKVRTKLRIYSILIALYLVLFVAALDQTVVATSIPTISASLQSASGYTWIGAAYLLANAASGPIWARCSDIWGRKPALLVAVIIFAAASTLAALSTSMRMLIAARALQGAAGGGLIPLVTITISDLFSVRRRSLYIGSLGAVWAVAGSAGPLVGGALTELAGWRWCFWINLPVCGAAFAITLLALNVHNPRTGLVAGLLAVDWFGTLAILAVTLLLLLGLDFGGATFPWASPQVICLLVFGALMVGVFVLAEARLARFPLMPPGVLFGGGGGWAQGALFVLAFAHSAVAVGAEFYLPLYFQSVHQASPLRSGVMILPMLASEAAADVLAGVLIHRTGRYRELMQGGAALMTLGTGLYVAFGSGTSVATVAGFEIVAGLGTALLFQTPMLALQNTVVRQADTAAATATMGFIRNVATSLSVVAGGALFQNSMDAQQPGLAAAGLPAAVLDALVGSQAAANVGVVAELQGFPAQQDAVRDAFAWSLRNLFIMYACTAGVALVASLSVTQKHMSEEHTETKTGIENLTERQGNS